MRCLGGQKWLKLDSKMSSIRGTSGLNSHTVYEIIWKLFFCKKKDANKNSSPCIQRRSLSLGAWRFIIVIILSYAIGRRQSFDITYHPKQRTAGLSKGAFHSTKYFCLKFPSQVITFQVSHVNTKQTKRKQENKNKPFLPFFLLALELLDDSKVETNDIFGEKDDVTCKLSPRQLWGYDISFIPWWVEWRKTCWLARSCP